MAGSSPVPHEPILHKRVLLDKCAHLPQGRQASRVGRETALLARGTSAPALTPSWCNSIVGKQCHTLRQTDAGRPHLIFISTSPDQHATAQRAQRASRSRKLPAGAQRAGAPAQQAGALPRLG